MVVFVGSCHNFQSHAAGVHRFKGSRFNVRVLSSGFRVQGSRLRAKGHRAKGIKHGAYPKTSGNGDLKACRNWLSL